MGVRIRDWIVALSLAAALGMLVGGVYSGVTGWQGPAGGMAGGSGVTRTASAGSGLPTPNEVPSPAAAPRRPAAAVSTAQVWSAQQPSHTEPAKASRTAKGNRDCQDGVGDGGKPDCEHGEKSDGGHGRQPAGEQGKSRKHGG